MATFSDQVLIDILKKAARRINRKLCLSNTADEVVIDDVGDMTSPDLDTNQDLYDLTLLQAECLISTREYQSELRDAGGGVVVKDGETTDTRGAGVARGTFYDSDYSPCAELADWIFKEKLNRQGGGAGPGRLVW
jgi:hypothetical protein